MHLIAELQREGLSIAETRAYLHGVTSEAVEDLLENTVQARVSACMIADVRRLLAADPRS